MSKALEVLLELKDCSDSWCEYYVPIGIHARIAEAIQELLPQPEPAALKLHGSAAMETFNEEVDKLLNEQEPVGIVITIGGYPDDSEHTVKLTCRHRDLKDGDLLYTLPPKREPLNDGDIADGCRACKNATNPDSFWAGVRYAEKTHNITGGD